MKAKTNYDKFLEERLKDPKFKEIFDREVKLLELAIKRAANKRS